MPLRSVLKQMKTQRNDRCYKCGKLIVEEVKCPYDRLGYRVCKDCCEKCYVSEPFPCEEYDEKYKK